MDLRTLTLASPKPQHSGAAWSDEASAPTLSALGQEALDESRVELACAEIWISQNFAVQRDRREMPSTMNISRARDIREMASLRSFARTINFAIRES